MHQPRKRLVQLPERNIVVAGPVHDFAVTILARRTAMAPFRPPGRFVGAALFFFPVEFIVGQRTTDERESFQSRLHPLALGFQPFGFAP